MVQIQVQKRLRYSVAGISLVSGLIVFWIALCSSGSDWFISETHADIIYTGLHRLGEFPFFSFVFNGGSYFLQDPQSNLFSPAVPLILLAGPTVGLRLMEAVWGGLGVYVFALWMRRRVSPEAALVGAVASAMSLGVLWRIAVGNDMFLWHLGLPALLWAVETVLKERSLRSTLVFGLVLGALLLGPTFHSFMYLFLPVVPLFVILELAFARPKLAELAKTAGLLAAGCALAVLIASPKLVCWATFQMSRPVADAGVLSVRDALRGLFNYGATRHVFFAGNYGGLRPGKLGLEECAAALPPVALPLTLLGLASPVWVRAHRSTALLAILLLVSGLTLSCSWPVWRTFLVLTGNNFRVAPRFLGMAAFALCTFASLGAEVIFTRWKRAALPGMLVAASLMFVSAIWWTHSAAKVTWRSKADTVHLHAINPIQRALTERASVAGLRSFRDLTELVGHERAILHGNGYSDGFLVVGNDFVSEFWDWPDPLPIVAQGGDASEIRVRHTSIVVDHLVAGGRVMLREREPQFGLAVTTRPPGGAVNVHMVRGYLAIDNRGDSPIDRVIVRARLPISIIWFIASLAGLLGGLAALIALAWRKGSLRSPKLAVARGTFSDGTDV